jgi:ABC-type transporter Mla maintaining outer membrane lipid asymmetry ATPase subunit MlaF
MEGPATSSDTPALWMEGVAVASMQDPQVIVADEINWTVNTGDYWVIAGLQGSGKSDFLMLAGGMNAPKRGKYLFFGQQMPIFEDARLRERLRLGFVFEDARLLSRLTVRENVALPLQYHRNLVEQQVDGEVMRILEALELSAIADSLPGMLARGLQKRAALARALALKPEVLLVDNPLGGLDVRHANWWLGFLDQLSRGHPLLDNRPVTLVVASSDLVLWKGRARQFALLSEGRLRVLGGWNQVEAANEDLLREMLTGQTQTG